MCIRDSDYYVPNQKEAMKITETASPEDAISVLSRYFENPMVKLDKDGCMIAENAEEAAKWYRKAAEQGYAKAQDSLGDCYYCGWSPRILQPISLLFSIRSAPLPKGRILIPALPIGALEANTFISL